VSLESGAAVYRRLAEAAGGVTPETIVSLGPEGIMRAGATRQKTGYIVSLARSILEGEIDLDDLEEADPVEARARLLSISGVGPWTADVYLLSALGHPDMFPVGDRALQVGTAEVLEMSEIPD